MERKRFDLSAWKVRRAVMQWSFVAMSMAWLTIVPASTCW